MDLFLNRQKPEPLDDLSVLESYLKNTLTPVSPDEGFVRDLQSRLFSEAFTYQGISVGSLVQLLLLTTGVLMGASVIFVTGIRLMIGILGLIGMLQSARQRLPR
jgi:hypothetical protein